MKLKRLLSLFLLISSQLCLSQEKMVLTLDGSIRTALENNPQLKIAEKEFAKSKSAVGESYSAILPTLNGTANFQRAWDIQQTTIPNFLKFMLGPALGLFPEFAAMPDNIQIAFGLENTFFYGVTVTQPLFLGGAGIAGIKIAYAAKRAAEQNLKSTRQNLIYQTSQAFYSCLLAKELIEVTCSLAQGA